MYQQNSYYPQTMRQPQMMMPQPQTLPFYLKGRPVASIDEAKAMSIDFDGTIFYFPDLANKRIYTKQINMDGTATLNVYEIKDIPVSSGSSLVNNDYITRKEFEETIAKLTKNSSNENNNNKETTTAQNFNF